MNTSIALAVVVVLTVIQSLIASPLNSNEIQGAYTTNDCPPGIWVCKKSAMKQPAHIQRVDRQSNKRAKAPELGVVKGGYKNDNCPPGVWMCKKKRTIAKKRLDMFRKMMQEKAQQEAQMKMAAKASHQKRMDECPPGIWVC